MENKTETKIALLGLIIGILIISCSYAVYAGSVESEFITSTNLPYCDINGRYWWTSTGASSSADNCYEPLVETGSSNNCCPSGQSCINDKCTVVQGVDYCSDYKTADSCKAYTSPVAYADVNVKIAPLTCQSSWRDENSSCNYYISLCRCFWNSSAGICQSDYDFEKECEGIKTPMGKCIFTTVNNNCTAGYRIVEWTASISPPGSELPENVKCESGSERVKCSFTELSFFTTISVVILAGLMIVFYVFYSKKDKKKLKK